MSVEWLQAQESKVHINIKKLDFEFILKIHRYNQAAGPTRNLHTNIICIKQTLIQPM